MNLNVAERIRTLLSVNRLGHSIHGKNQSDRLTWQGGETEPPIELGCAFIQCVDDHGKDRHYVARHCDPLQGIRNQDGAQALTLLRLVYRQATQQRYRDGVPGQPAPNSLRPFGPVTGPKG